MSDMRSKRQAPLLQDATPEAGESPEPIDVQPVEVGEELEPLEVLDEDEDASDTTEAERLELRVRGDLEERGIVGGEAARLAEALTERLIERGPDGYEDLVAGAQMVHHVRVDLASDLADSHRELRQLERLMGGFATELRKLDEVLEVLAAYVRRMRGSASDNGRQTLH